MSVMTHMSPLALSTQYVTTQQGPSSAHVLRGTNPSAWVVRISTNARTTPPAVLTRCAPTCLEHTTALVHWGIMRRNRHVSTPMNVRIHLATPRHGAGTPLAPFHATAQLALLEMAPGAKMWMSVSPCPNRATLLLTATTLQGHLYVCVNPAL